jgi:hypothetical protein
VSPVRYELGFYIPEAEIVLVLANLRGDIRYLTCLRRYTRSRKVAGSNPDEVTAFLEFV